MYIRFYPKDASVEARAEFFKHWHKMKSACTAPPSVDFDGFSGERHDAITLLLRYSLDITQWFALKRCRRLDRHRNDTKVKLTVTQHRNIDSPGRHMKLYNMKQR